MAESSSEIPVEAAAEAEAQAARKETRKVWLRRLAIGVALGAAAALLYHLLIGRNYESTDNAYVNAEMAQVTPLINGTVIEVRIKDTQMVKRGEVLVMLDPSVPRTNVAAAEAELAAARRRFRQTVSTNSADFGPHTLVAKGIKELCVPAIEGP